MDTNKLTDEQKKSIKYAESKHYHYIGMKQIKNDNCAIVRNGNDKIYIYEDGKSVNGLSIEKAIAVADYLPMEQNDKINQLIEKIINRVLNEEAGLTAKFDKLINNYRDLLKQQQDLIKTFVNDLKNEVSPVRRELMKKKYIADKKELDKKIADAKLKTDTAIVNLPVGDDDDKEHDFMKD